MENAASMNDLPAGFIYDIDHTRSNNGSLVLRTNLKSQTECEQWVSAYEQRSKTKWIVSHVVKQPFRYISRKSWQCHLSKRNKIKNSKRSWNCRARIDIKIKKFNKNTKKKDAFLKRDPPLNAIVILELNHNHLLESDHVLQYLRISSGIKQQFETYFKDGLSSLEACEVHELKLKHIHGIQINLSDGSINPSITKVYGMYRRWQRTIAAGAEPINCMQKQQDLKSET